MIVEGICRGSVPRVMMVAWRCYEMESMKAVELVNRNYKCMKKMLDRSGGEITLPTAPSYYLMRFHMKL